MRKILFRGKALDNGKWAEGDLAMISNRPFIIPAEALAVEVDPRTVGQFTGLHDRGGACVFEGDLVAVSGGFPRAVRYDGGCAAFCLGNPGADGGHGFLQIDADWWRDFQFSIRVVGNEHDDLPSATKSAASD